MKALRVDRAKVVDYLLNPTNSRGKAAFFLGMGFRIEQWQELSRLLKAQATSGVVSQIVESPHGTRYCVDGSFDTPDGRSPPPRIRTVWIEEYGSEEWRLITAYPLRGR